MRKVKEWTARHDDQAIPDSVKLRIFDKYGGRCAECQAKTAPGRFDYDHIIALCNGGPHAEHNLQLLCLPHHKGKSASDAAERAKVNRKRKKHLGIRKPRSIRAWRKFNGEIVRAERER